MERECEDRDVKNILPHLLPARPYLSTLEVLILDLLIVAGHVLYIHSMGNSQHPAAEQHDSLRDCPHKMDMVAEISFQCFGQRERDFFPT